MKRNGNEHRLRQGTRVRLKTDFSTGGHPARVYLAGSEGKITTPPIEHRGKRTIKAVMMESPLPGIINVPRGDLEVIS